MIAHLKMSIKHLEDSVAFYEASEESLKSELAMATIESTWPGRLFDNVRAEVIKVQLKLAA